MRRTALLVCLLSVLVVRASAQQVTLEELPDKLMGDYIGTFKPAAGEEQKAVVYVVPDGKERYRVVFQTDIPGHKGKISRLLLRGMLKDGVIKIDDSGAGVKWTGTVGNGKAAAESEKGDKYAAEYTIRKSPTLGAKPPEGAIVLLKYPCENPPLDEWINKNWKPMPDGSVEVFKGDNKTVRSFGDMKLHLEFRCCYDPISLGQGRSNSGVYLQDRYEVQVLDSYGLRSADNDCGGIYKIAKPRVNACCPPLSWQTYDMTFRAARFDAAGKVVKPVTVTVEHNGEVIHDNLVVPGPTGGAAGADAVPTAPLRLQDHGNPVRYRNIWVVELKDQ
ncbi:MAG TPA: DUF1080 domain-containing protein [Candidatus Brocadiia bacterium]|nr:DUF1080 domain-containing protein [Candidatus Brocadiia bacterium]